jgi:hypothetical protein
VFRENGARQGLDRAPTTSSHRTPPTVPPIPAKNGVTRAEQLTDGPSRGFGDREKLVGARRSEGRFLERRGLARGWATARAARGAARGALESTLAEEMTEQLGAMRRKRRSAPDSPRRPGSTSEASSTAPGDGGQRPRSS